MKLARYIGNGQVAIVDEEPPCLPEGGLLVKTAACGLCSGELMDWYMDRKVPHVLGHEVSGKVIESDVEGISVGSHVFAHHHVACGECDLCRRGLFVHCHLWKNTKLIPGGMAEIFAVPKDNLRETFLVNSLRPQDAALIEPLACVLKSVGRERIAGDVYEPGYVQTRAVIGLGALGLLHMLVMGNATGYDLREDRIAWAQRLGLDARHSDQAEPADTVVACPGSQVALDLAAKMVGPGGNIILFAPIPGATRLDLDGLYFRDVAISTSYSCGPLEIANALKLLEAGNIKAEQVISDFITLDQLPEAYQAMKNGEILKAMVMFS
jgi:L-iditol 2-dehydrogenase